MFALPLVLEACGYLLPEDRIKKMSDFITEKNIDQLTLDVMMSVLSFSKAQDLQAEQENDLDEYLEAFVALGGKANKEGFVSKEILIQIIKLEFEMTLDMEEYLRKSICGEGDENA